MEINELTALKNKIKTAENQVANLEGQKTELMKRLKTEFECSTIEEAEQKIVELEAYGDKLTKRMEKKEAKLRESYPALFEDEA